MTSPATAADLIRAIRDRNRASINDVAAKLLDQRASLGEQWSEVAQVLLRNGEVTLALRAASMAVDGSRGSAKSKFGLAQILAASGHQREAMQVVAEMPRVQLGLAQREHFGGTCALELGDLDYAREAFERVVAASPVSGPSWLSLSALPAGDDEDLLSRLEAAGPAIAPTPADNRAQWHYARGTVLDRLVRRQEAFAEFSAGAELMRSTRPFDRAADLEQAQRLISGFNADALESTPSPGADTSRPIFVVGLPRSGTTLVEHILSAHSALAGGGEVPFASILIREIGGNSVEAVQAYSRAHGADALAQLYLHLGDERFGAGSRFVDKWLGNTRTLGLVASILPQSKIIYLRRDPLDCAWSCFKTFFTQRIDWSWSLEDIAAHFTSEDLLYDHWREVLGDRVLTVSYEEFVADPQPQIDRVLKHVGLKREAAIDEAHKAKRAVTTASLAQVREPVYQRAVGAAEPYREWLTPLFAAYAETASAS